MIHICYVDVITAKNYTQYQCHKWSRIYSTCRKYFSVLSLFMTFHRVCRKSNTTGDTNGAGTTYPSGPPKFTPVVRVARSLFFSVVIYRSLFILVSFFLLTVVLSILLLFADCNSFGIFKLFQCQCSDGRSADNINGVIFLSPVPNF
jgi:hypothetical protein